MNAINNGGPAFPRPQAETSQGGNFEQDGMHLRDWFAGQAIGAVIRQCAVDMQTNTTGETYEQYFARTAYAIADALLAAREVAK